MIKVGADRRKVGILGGLLLVAAYFFYSNVISPGDDAPPSARRTPSQIATGATPQVTPGQAATAQSRTRSGTRAGASLEYRPKFRISKPGEGPDISTADPTLRLDLLAKVQSVNLEGGERNLFQFGAAPPPPKVEAPKIIPKPVIGPKLPESVKTAEAVKPPPPPIPLKFYGYASQVRPNEKRAFFLEGEDIIVASEGETIKRRYKVVRIGINSVVVEDIQFKHQQTLALEEQPG